MPRVLIAHSANDEQKILLDKERLIIGRDKDSDLYLEADGVSRKHAAIIYRFGAVYIENISSTGQIFRGDDPVEYVELAKDEIIKIGPYTLCWTEQEIPLLKTPAPAAEAAAALNIDAASSPTAVNHLNDMQEAEVAISANPGVEAQENFQPDFMLNASPGEDEKNSNEAVQNIHAEEEQAPELSSDLFLANSSPQEASGAFSTSDSTKISEQSLSATLKLLKGEEEVREIKLGTDKNEWIVGRGSKCDIPMENAKLSRQHFKIVRAGRKFHIVDLESAAGTLLNGISVKESPLSSFDTIKIGPVEIQFMIGEIQKAVDSGNLLLMTESPYGLTSAPQHLKLEGSEEFDPQVPLEKTAFAAPMPYSPHGGGYQANPSHMGGFGGTGKTGFHIPNPNGHFQGASSNPRAEVPKGVLDKIKIWSEELNPRQKALYSVLIAVLVGGLFYKNFGEEASGPAPSTADRQIASQEENESTAAAAAAATPSPPESNAAITGDIHPNFYKLPADKRSALEETYAKAERAYQAKNWNEAYRFSKEVLDQVDPFKKANEILYDSQLQKNNNMLGNISSSLNNIQDAAKENAEKLEILVEEGEKALSEGRWEDAEENFLRAVTLDPNHKRAQQGFIKARSKDMTANVSLPDEQVQIDPEAEKRQTIADEFIGLRKVYNDSRQKILQGNFGAGLQTLKQLDLALRERSVEFKDSRTPASVREFANEQSVNLQLQIREAIDNARAQLEVNYQTQMADAEAFASNKQYVQAKEIYNKILRIEPEFDLARGERAKLYSKILSEAKEKYQESLIYETVGDIEQALEGYEQTKELLNDVDDVAAIEYFKKAQLKIRRLKR